MTEQNEPTQGMDPRAAFLADQQAAEAEGASRDQIAWDNHVADQVATIAMKVEAARLEGAKATLRNTIAFLIGTLTALGLIVAAVVAFQTILGWFA